jgi:hypothetical protein
MVALAADVVGSSYQLFITIGILVAECINYGTEARQNPQSWRIPTGISFLWSSILGIGIVLMPEAPRYAYRKGDVDAAKRTMARSTVALPITLSFSRNLGKSRRIFLIASFTPSITSTIDFRFGYVLAKCCLAAAVIVYFCLIES